MLVHNYSKSSFCVRCMLCDCVPCQTNEITECVLLSILLRQLFSSCAKPFYGRTKKSHQISSQGRRKAFRTNRHTLYLKKYKVYKTSCPANSYNANLGRTRHQKSIPCTHAKYINPLGQHQIANGLKEVRIGLYIITATCKATV